MFHKMTVGLLAAAAVASAASVQADVFNMPSGETSLQFVTVSNPGNPADMAVMKDGTSGYGSVSYVYQMGKYDVTLGQYTACLNAVAKTDPYGLYDSDMAGYLGTYPFGISRTGTSGNYSYSVTGSNPQAANMPVYDEIVGRCRPILQLAAKWAAQWVRRNFHNRGRRLHAQWRNRR